MVYKYTYSMVGEKTSQNMKEEEKGIDIRSGWMVTVKTVSHSCWQKNNIGFNLFTFQRFVVSKLVKFLNFFRVELVWFLVKHREAGSNDGWMVDWLG